MSTQVALRNKFLSEFPNIRYGLGEWRQYTSGVWQRVDEKIVKRHLQEIVGNSAKLTSSLINSVTDLLSSQTYIPSQLFDSNPNVLVFNNTCLDLITYAEVPHSPHYYATNKLDFNYDPTA